MRIMKHNYHAHFIVGVGSPAEGSSLCANNTIKKNPSNYILNSKP